MSSPWVEPSNVATATRLRELRYSATVATLREMRYPTHVQEVR